MASKGRRFKYLPFLEILAPDEVYSPATIVRFGELEGLLDHLNPEEIRAARRKIRHTLARLSTNRGFPYKGDGWVEIPGQAPLRGWFGWRWKDAVSLDSPPEATQQT